ncbi:MAG: hypothetical protein EOM12_16805 [Verrucomicrobiae bacterium]|nr:hypothetical protein [Verrucomicrobiae bacterium]
MKDALVLHVGEFYASHLKALLKRNSSLEMNNIRLSLGNYFKAKDDQYWESLYAYCKKRNDPWNLYFLCNKFTLAFDKALASRMNEVYLLNEAFLSSHSLALALGKPVPSNTPQPAKAVDRSLSSEMSQKDRIGMTQSLRFSWDSFSGFR